jgi:signal transduction histidine kinase
VIEVLDDGPVLSVADEGPGIRAEDRERVFERFYREGDPDQSGAGLGLSIVKRICDLTGARIRLADNVPVDSQRQRPGLRIEVAFQRAASAATTSSGRRSSYESF